MFAGLALSFGAPLVLFGLIALPIIWWLLKLTPPRPQSETFPPLRILQQILKTEETPSKSPWWLTLLRLLPRRPDHLRARLADAEPAREPAVGVRPAGAHGRQWLGVRRRLGRASQRGRGVDPRGRGRRPAGRPGLHRRRAERRRHPRRGGDRARTTGRRFAPADPHRPSGRRRAAGDGAFRQRAGLARHPFRRHRHKRHGRRDAQPRRAVGRPGDRLCADCRPAGRPDQCRQFHRGTGRRRGASGRGRRDRRRDLHAARRRFPEPRGRDGGVWRSLRVRARRRRASRSRSSSGTTSPGWRSRPPPTPAPCASSTTASAAAASR